jgi:hypothetical protein
VGIKGWLTVAGTYLCLLVVVTAVACERAAQQTPSLHIAAETVSATVPAATPIQGGVSSTSESSPTCQAGLPTAESSKGEWPSSSAQVSATSISGLVLDERGPVVGATVRVQATEIATSTDEEGRFVLSGLTPGQSVRVTAWAPGYYIVGGEGHLPGDHVMLTLVKHADVDDETYAWLSAFSADAQESNCENCHSSSEVGITMPFEEWLLDAHSGSAQNPRFLNMYEGTDSAGNQSPPTRYGQSRDYGQFPLRPDPEQPYYGPGYKLDFPDTDGNCAACHVPAAAIDAPYSTDPRAVTGAAAEGVSCDFCHKVWDVVLDSATGAPYPDMPGVLSMEFLRPSAGHQFFAGPYDDVAPGEDTYSGAQEESQFCASCHHGVFWDVLVYGSFDEWLASQYSDPETGQTCQDCHMPPLGSDHFARPEEGGLHRDLSRIFSHRMPGAADEALLQDTVTMDVSAEQADATIRVQVSLTNYGAGHDVPTDSPLRNLILLVDARDTEGQPLDQVDGPTVPEWGGVGDESAGNYAGLPGKGFAKVLEELWTEVAPTGAYWRQTRVLEDNRIPAMATDISTYTFAAPTKLGQVTIDVQLLFRRAFKPLADLKGWDIPDILMERQAVTLDTSR